MTAHKVIITIKNNDSIDELYPKSSAVIVEYGNITMYNKINNLNGA